MTTRISHIPFYHRIPITDGQLLIWATAYAVPLIPLFLWKPILAIIYGVAPFVLLLVSHGISTIYLLIAGTFLFLPLNIGFVLLPADIMAIILVAAYLTDIFVRGPSPQRNPLAGFLMTYVGIVFLSIALEGFTVISVRYFLRQLVLAGTFLAVAHFGRRIDPGKVILAFIFPALFNSLYSIVQFFGAGGKVRAFGLAGHGYGDHAMIGIMISVIFYLWASDLRAKIFWGGSSLIMIGAMAATQTRASAITAGWGIMVVILLSLWIGKRIKCRNPRRGIWTALIAGILIIPPLALYTPIFEGIIYRFGHLGFQATGTVLLRVSLWKAAISAFLANPVLGIGAGNFVNISNWVPTVKFDPIYHWVSGMGTHVVVLTALAETGILGLVALLIFMGKTVQIAFRRLSALQDAGDIPYAMILFIIALTVLGSSFYAGSWFWGNNSYHMAVFFGLVASYRSRSAPVLSTSGK